MYVDLGSESELFLHLNNTLKCLFNDLLLPVLTIKTNILLYVKVLPLETVVVQTKWVFVLIFY